MTKEGDFLRKYNDVWNKVNKSIKKGFDSKPIYNKQMLKFKIKCRSKNMKVFTFPWYKETNITANELQHITDDVNTFLLTPYSK